MLVPLILLGTVNMLVIDTRAQIEVTKARKRPDWTQQAVKLSQHFCCSNNCMSMDGQDVSIGPATRCDEMGHFPAILNF